MTKKSKNWIPRINERDLMDVIKQYNIIHTPLPEGLYGLCDPLSKTIHINSETAGISREKTSIHEVLHALDDLKDWNISERKVHKLEDYFHNKWYGGQ